MNQKKNKKNDQPKQETKKDEELECPECFPEPLAIHTGVSAGNSK